AAVFVGADSMGRALGVSSYIANLIVAMSLLTMLLAGLVTRYRLSWR
ncbi:MAG TPA: ABC transporter permease, partial [Alphaproteobacteria bacterium]|nr:ABC transporter permease [Alphaproteobacteria bacterium]